MAQAEPPPDAPPPIRYQRPPHPDPTIESELAPLRALFPFVQPLEKRYLSGYAYFQRRHRLQMADLGVLWQNKTPREAMLYDLLSIECKEERAFIFGEQALKYNPPSRGEGKTTASKKVCISSMYYFPS